MLVKVNANPDYPGKHFTIGEPQNPSADEQF